MTSVDSLKCLQVHTSLTHVICIQCMMHLKVGNHETVMVISVTSKNSN
jgi:hypothetical protein